jgi:hypothetical protein
MKTVFNLTTNSQEIISYSDIVKRILNDNQTLQVDGAIVNNSNLISWYKTISLDNVVNSTNEYQSKVENEDNKNRLKRYEKNVECANAILSGVYRQSEMDSIQEQFDASKLTHPIISKLDLQKFCEWIMIQNDFAIKSVGAIESIYILTKSAINASDTVEKIDLVLTEAKQKAELKFIELHTDMESRISALLQ